ncbi:MAG: hypothetical protein V1720_19750 [bacterium]
MIFHGYVRYTGDLDVWINNDDENAIKMLEVIADFGFSSLELKKEDFTTPNSVTQLGYPPDRIDILNSVEELEFFSCFERRKTIKFGSLEIGFLDLEDLKKNKKSVGRTRDINDLENLP